MFLFLGCFALWTLVFPLSDLSSWLIFKWIEAKRLRGWYEIKIKTPCSSKEKNECDDFNQMQLVTNMKLLTDVKKSNSIEIISRWLGWDWKWRYADLEHQKPCSLLVFSLCNCRHCLVYSVRDWLEAWIVILSFSVPYFGFIYWLCSLFLSKDRDHALFWFCSLDDYAKLCFWVVT